MPGQPQLSQRPLRSTSVTLPMPDAGRWGFDFDLVATGLGVIATFTSSRHETSPQVVQRKWG